MKEKKKMKVKDAIGFILKEEIEEESCIFIFEGV